MGKIKVEKPDAADVDTSVVKEEDTYDEKLKNANAISQPMASKKLTKKIHKLIEKGRWNLVGLSDFVWLNWFIFYFVAAKQKSYLRNGLKDVQVRLRKGETG